MGRQKSHRDFGYSVVREKTQTERVVPVAKTTVNLIVQPLLREDVTLSSIAGQEPHRAYTANEGGRDSASGTVRADARSHTSVCFHLKQTLYTESSLLFIFI